MNRSAVLALLAATALSGCASDSGKDGRPPESEIAVQASRLARDLLVVDTHIDLPYRLNRRMEDVTRRTEFGDFDYQRARAGGLNVAFMSIYIPAELQESGGARQLADELIDMVETLAAEHPDKFALVVRTEEAPYRLRDVRVGLALGMENGAGLEGKLENLSHFYDRGIRYITLAHSKSNRICDSSYDEERQWNGLSPFGREVVAEMNRLGIMVDVSHISDEAFYQVLELSRAPVIASHSSCRHFTPGWERNMSDEMIRKLADAGGVIQINFGSSFLDDGYRLKSEELRDRIRAHLDEHDIVPDSDEAEQVEKEFRAADQLETTDVRRVADHIDHVVQLVGIDHVGLGSDFDGVGDSLPTGLKDVSQYGNLLGVLLTRGYSTGDIAKICSGNLLRVWGAVEDVAAE
jgi:membrane dipeptidase